LPVSSQLLYATDDTKPGWLQELTTGRPVKRLPLPVFEVMTPALSHDGTIVAGWNAKGIMALHRARPSGEFNDKPALLWSPSGEQLHGAEEWLAVGTFDGLMLVDRTKRTWQHLSRVEHQPTAFGVAWSEDGTVRGSPEARRATWMRTSTDLLGSLATAL
jgi:hypothetical protein